jgi:hypothetical protein
MVTGPETIVLTAERKLGSADCVTHHLKSAPKAPTEHVPEQGCPWMPEQYTRLVHGTELWRIACDRAEGLHSAHLALSEEI